MHPERIIEARFYGAAVVQLAEDLGRRAPPVVLSVGVPPAACGPRRYAILTGATE